MTSSPAELEREIEAAREALARDLDALTEKAAPRRLAGAAAKRAVERTRAWGARLLGRARSRPLPLAVIGGAAAGAVWLLARGRSRARQAVSR